MASKVDICNMALGNVGAKNLIESIDEPSTEARQCKLWFTPSLKKTLEAFDWGFARTRQTLAEDGEDPPDEWSYRYQYPATCVKLRLLWNPLGRAADAVPYIREVNAAGVPTVLTNLEDAVGIFTFLQLNTAVYPALFDDALAFQLAASIAYKLTGKRAVKADMVAEFHTALALAAASDANEEIAEPPREAPWIEGR
jgi:hypothetical protein